MFFGKDSFILSAKTESQQIIEELDSKVRQEGFNYDWIRMDSIPWSDGFLRVSYNVKMNKNHPNWSGSFGKNPKGVKVVLLAKRLLDGSLFVDQLKE